MFFYIQNGPKHLSFTEPQQKSYVLFFSFIHQTLWERHEQSINGKVAKWSVRSRFYAFGLDAKCESLGENLVNPGWYIVLPAWDE